MNIPSLQIFVDQALASGAATARDLRRLEREILADGLSSRDEADLLIALGRSGVALPDGWTDWLSDAVVAYAVWTERRTGTVDADAARWLVSSLSAGAGPTDTARRIAFEVVKEAQWVDESLIAFVLGARRRLHTTKDAVDLAA